MGVLQAQTARDYAQKTVNITRFLNHINFPSTVNIGDEYIVGIIGDDYTVQNLSNYLSVEKAKGKRILVKNIQKSREIQQVHLVYFTKTGGTKMLTSAAFRQAEGRPIIFLTEEENKDYLQKGSDLNFVIPKGTWRYELNLGQLTSKGFTISEELKNKAVNIEKEAVVIVKNNPKNNNNNALEDEKIRKEREAALERIRQAELKTKQLLAQIETSASPEEIKKMQKEYDSLMAGLTEKDKLAKFMSMQTQNIKNQAALEKANREKEKQAQEARQRFVLTIGIGILLLVSIVATIFFIFSIRRKRIIQKLEITQKELSNTINEVNEKNSQIEHQNQLLVSKTKEIEEANKKTVDSIRSAYTIQQAMLPSKNQIQSIFKDTYLIYQPKDIVSGDFYWLSQQNNYIFVSVADCTGHGVPGAFMSMIGINLLNEIINEKHITQPAEILEDLHQGIIEGLKQNETDNRDGMDIIMCRLEKKGNKSYEMVFSGAKRPLYYTQKGLLKKISGDNKYLGGIKKDSKKFTNHITEIFTDDWIYMFSDGYPDMPNPQKKKFGSIQLENILEQIKEYDGKIQEEVLLEKLERHKGTANSRDDVTFWGIKIP